MNSGRKLQALVCHNSHTMTVLRIAATVQYSDTTVLHPVTISAVTGRFGLLGSSTGDHRCVNVSTPTVIACHALYCACLCACSSEDREHVALFKEMEATRTGLTGTHATTLSNTSSFLNNRHLALQTVDQGGWANIGKFLCDFEVRLYGPSPTYIRRPRIKISRCIEHVCIVDLPLNKQA